MLLTLLDVVFIYFLKTNICKELKDKWPCLKNRNKTGLQLAVEFVPEPQQ